MFVSNFCFFSVLPSGYFYFFLLLMLLLVCLSYSTKITMMAGKIQIVNKKKRSFLLFGHPKRWWWWWWRRIIPSIRCWVQAWSLMDAWLESFVEEKKKKSRFNHHHHPSSILRKIFTEQAKRGRKGWKQFTQENVLVFFIWRFFLIFWSIDWIESENILYA